MNEIHYQSDRLDLNLLRVFEVIYRERHLTKAAETLCLTPSAVSHALRRLREHFDDPLFARNGKVMQPTPKCLRLAPDLLEQLSRLHHFLHEWRSFDPNESRHNFRISIPEAVEVMILPRLYADFNSQAPMATLTSARSNRGEMASALASQSLNIAIDIALPIEDPIRHAPFIKDKLSVIAKQTHEIMQKPGAKAYSKARHIVVSKRSTGTVMEDALLLDEGITRNIAIRCQNYQAAINIVEQTDLILTMPTMLAHELAMNNDVAIIPLPAQLPSVQLHLYWHADSEGDPAFEWLKKVIMNQH